ncbi:hypothetical protein T484DRAFT_1756789, partial [Baffinella frigidus]
MTPLEPTGSPPSEGKRAKDSEELCGDDGGYESPIRRKIQDPTSFKYFSAISHILQVPLRKISHPSITSPHSGGKNPVKARNCTSAANAIAIKGGKLKKKLKISKRKEGNALEARKAFDWAELPPGEEVSSIKLIFTKKVNQQGQIEYQCRLSGGERVFSEEKDQAATKKSRTTERLEDFTTKPLSKDPFIQMRTDALGTSMEGWWESGTALLRERKERCTESGNRSGQPRPPIAQQDASSTYGRQRGTRKKSGCQRMSPQRGGSSRSSQMDPRRPTASAFPDRRRQIPRRSSSPEIACHRPNSAQQQSQTSRHPENRTVGPLPGLPLARPNISSRNGTAAAEHPNTGCTPLARLCTTTPPHSATPPAPATTAPCNPLELTSADRGHSRTDDPKRPGTRGGHRHSAASPTAPRPLPHGHRPTVPSIAAPRHTRRPDHSRTGVVLLSRRIAAPRHTRRPDHSHTGAVHKSANLHALAYSPRALILPSEIAAPKAAAPSPRRQIAPAAPPPPRRQIAPAAKPKPAQGRRAPGGNPAPNDNATNISLPPGTSLTCTGSATQALLHMLYANPRGLDRRNMQLQAGNLTLQEDTTAIAGRIDGLLRNGWAQLHGPSILTMIPLARSSFATEGRHSDRQALEKALRAGPIAFAYRDTLQAAPDPPRIPAGSIMPPPSGPPPSMSPANPRPEHAR